MKYFKPNPALAISIFLLLAISFPLSLPAEVIKIMAANLTSGSDQAYEEPGIRIFQALKPDVVLIQEFNYESGSLRDLVDRAFGPEFRFMVEGGSEQIPNGIVSRWPILSYGEWNDSIVPNRDFAWAVIDIPGEKHLQVVSVHLYSQSGGSDTDRANEAKAIWAQVTANFDANQYIVVGGDLNTGSRTESAINIFKTFLDADDHTPVDRNYNSNTNEGRTSPYDWVMPNAELDQYHATLYVGSANRAYPQGIVFDSHVYTPLSEVYPVQYPDSHVINMQHMAVMKAYDIPVEIPTGFMINEGFTGFQLGVRPAGWEFIGCNQNTDTSTIPGEWGAAPPSINFNGTGDAVVTQSFSISQDEQLYFWAKLNFGSGADALKLEEFRSGSWQEIATINNLPSTGRDFGPYPVSQTATRIRFTFTRDRGTCALDDIRITGPARPNPPWNGDYDGNRRSDPAIFRPASGLWAVRGMTRMYFGSSGDEPVFGDYSGDGTARTAIFRENSGLWSVRGVTRMYFGGSGDIPVPGDYDGSGFCRAAIYRPGSGLWSVRGLTRLYFGGQPDDIPVPGYYGPENRAVIAIYRPASGMWAARGVTRLYFGSASDTPVPGDYTSAGQWTPAIFKPSTGLWYVAGGGRVYFGGSSDRPVPGDYAGEARNRVAIFRENNGLWSILGLTRTYFGTAGDVPATR